MPPMAGVWPGDFFFLGPFVYGVGARLALPLLFSGEMASRPDFGRKSGCPESDGESGAPVKSGNGGICEKLGSSSFWVFYFYNIQELGVLLL